MRNKITMQTSMECDPAMRIHGEVLDRKGNNKFVLIDHNMGAWQMARPERVARNNDEQKKRRNYEPKDCPVKSGQWRRRPCRAAGLEGSSSTISVTYFADVLQEKLEEELMVAMRAALCAGRLLETCRPAASTLCSTRQFG